MKRALIFSAVALLAVVSVNLTPAQAQPAHVFVAAQGSDSNPCTLAQPCLSFQHAHDTFLVCVSHSKGALQAVLQGRDPFSASAMKAPNPFPQRRLPAPDGRFCSQFAQQAVTLTS
jgi:hypothetical protein